MINTITGRLLIGAAFMAASAGTTWATSTSPHPAPAGDLAEALSNGKLNLDLRLRYERVEQDNPLDTADALTLRSLLGYTTQRWNGLSAFVEMENLSALIDHYSGTPPPIRYSVVADPEGTEVNQWGLRYAGIDGLVATVGRSKLIFDNARWVGNVGWRQNEQTFDGYFLKATPVPGVTLNGAYITNVNTIFFANIDLEGTLLNAQWVLMPALTLTAYAYLLDYAVITAATPDADTVGIRALGNAPLSPEVTLSYVAEFARQDARSLSGEFEADYWLGELALSFKGLSLALGYERLGSDDGQYAVMTPLATLHAHNGWNDLFLGTPPAGLTDQYVRLSGRVGKTAWMVKVHDFSADTDSTDYGRELNLQLTRSLIGRLNGGLKVGAYAADALAVDTEKLWAWLSWGF